jgi:hypothetical protein
VKVVKTEHPGEIFKRITHLGDVAGIERNIEEAKCDSQVEQSDLLACLALSAFQEVLCWRYQQPTASHVPQPQRRDIKSPALMVQYIAPEQPIRRSP